MISVEPDSEKRQEQLLSDCNLLSLTTLAPQKTKYSGNYTEDFIPEHCTNYRRSTTEKHHSEGGATSDNPCIPQGTTEEMEKSRTGTLKLVCPASSKSSNAFMRKSQRFLSPPPFFLKKKSDHISGFCFLFPCFALLFHIL